MQVGLDSYGACLHNNDTCAKAGKHKCDKVVRAGAYKFVYAFENTEESHYVTSAQQRSNARDLAPPTFRLSSCALL